MSLLNETRSQLLHALRPDGVLLFNLRALSAQPRAHLVPLLNRSLEERGCSMRRRSGGPSSLTIQFELPLRRVAELYTCLVECGVEFDRRSHRELATLCVLGQHLPETGTPDRGLNLQLELTFEEELELAEVQLCAALA